MSATRARKDEAFASDRAPFREAGPAARRHRVEADEGRAVAGRAFRHGEPLERLRPADIHGHLAGA